MMKFRFVLLIERSMSNKLQTPMNFIKLCKSTFEFVSSLLQLSSLCLFFDEFSCWFAESAHSKSIKRPAGSEHKEDEKIPRLADQQQSVDVEWWLFGSVRKFCVSQQEQVHHKMQKHAWIDVSLAYIFCFGSHEILFNFYCLSSFLSHLFSVVPQRDLNTARNFQDFSVRFSHPQLWS